jgi:pimeloyl-ACP methyl ester carboxylesterase
MRTFRSGAATVAYSDVGSGTAVIALHGSASSRRLWQPLGLALAGRYRVIAPDLHGYGETSPWTPGESAARDIELAVALADQVQGPLHLVGHSYGGVVALEAAVALGARVASLALVEPVVFGLLREARDDAWPAIAAIAGRHIELVEAGESETCAEAFVSYWAGANAWTAMSAPARARAVATMPKIADEWRLVFRLQRGRRDFARLGVPTLLVRGAHTTLAARRIVDRLAAALADREMVEIEGAGHLAPLSHAAAVCTAIAEHLARFEAKKPFADRPVA